MIKKLIGSIKNIKLEDILCLFVILCPILDMSSFIFRNMFNTEFSPSTFIRPIIPILSIIYIFFKDKFKKKIIIVFVIYGIYGLVHLVIYKQLLTESSYGGVISELQYIVNYSFMVLNLFIYCYILKKDNSDKIKKSVLIALGIYIISIFIAILTGTSSATYMEEGLGYKGWFESGNSLCAILCFGLCIVLPLIKDKKTRYITLAIVLLTGIFLTTLVGTRTGLLGFVLIVSAYIFAEVLVTVLRKMKINIKMILGGIFIIVLTIGVVGIVGSKTLERRELLKNKESEIVDNEKGEIAHVSGDLLKLKQQIERGELSESYMSKSAQKSILDLYEYAEKKQISNTDMRKQQLIYNYYLVINEHDIKQILFGDGFKTQFYELVMEMEVPSFLFNFGIIGFILYLGPFIAIFTYGMYIAVRNIKRIDGEYILLLVGALLSFALSFLSGYVFFNASSSLIIVVINVLILNETKKINQENEKVKI